MRYITKEAFILGIRAVDPKAELLESTIGNVIVFIEPNKLPEIAERVWNSKPIGIGVIYLPHPDYLPHPQFLGGRYGMF